MTTKYKVSELVPQRGDMILIDEIIEYDDKSLLACVTITNRSLFVDDNKGVPVWIGIEYMAQAVAAWVGIQAKKDNNPVIKKGLLVGTRKYIAHQSHFSIGSHLLINIQEEYNDNTLGVFKCGIKEHQLIAEAHLKVYQFL